MQKKPPFLPNMSMWSIVKSLLGLFTMATFPILSLLNYPNTIMNTVVISRIAFIEQISIIIILYSVITIMVFSARLELSVISLAGIIIILLLLQYLLYPQFDRIYPVPLVISTLQLLIHFCLVGILAASNTVITALRQL